MSPTLPLQQLCQQYHCLLLGEDQHHIQVAGYGDPPLHLIEMLKFTSGKQPKWHCWSQAQLEAAQREEHRSDPNKSYANKVTTQLLETLLTQAVSWRASDIHLEPQAEYLQIRLRIDGVLQAYPSPINTDSLRLIPQLKVLAELDIAERRLPQDGQLTLQLQQRPVTFRISTLPTRHGEKAVLRQVQETTQPFQLQELGFEQSALRQLQRTLELPQGLILVTGPTGSGKTATLYSSLNHLHSPQRNICSVEDPIESPLDGINQTAINRKAGLHFDNILRALLRQDPDIIMIGEIRDAETAAIAVNAAQTGHLVLSTLHTNSACETVLRLTQLGISPHLIASSLKLVIAQRLVRRLCPDCKVQHLSEEVPPPTHWQGNFNYWIAQGCKQCIGGYYGRRAIYEFLTITSEIQHLLLNACSIKALQQLALQQGMSTLWDVGLRLAHQGETTLAEVCRVLGAA